MNHIFAAVTILTLACYSTLAGTAPPHINDGESATSLRRSETLLTRWQFRRDHNMNESEGWQEVEVPHDWAISGPFSRDNDLQVVTVIQNGETLPSEKTGRSGGLPYMGKGCYRRDIDINLDGRQKILLFDGAMSEAKIYINGEKVFEWPYGYNSFWCDITSYVHEGSNEVVVLLENLTSSSRWYPGAGLYRKVRLLELPAVHIPVWGTTVSTPHVGADYASVQVRTSIEGASEREEFQILTKILRPDGSIATERTDTRAVCHSEPIQQNLTIEKPELWSPESPMLYHAVTYVMKDGAVLDSCSTRFGIRTVEFVADKGFFLNGERRTIHGVCQHHDLGPLGAAVNRSALRHQLELLKDMGCDAIRTSHNMPAEEIVELCDEMGFMMMVETFDEWDVDKCENGYHRYFNEWAEKDVVNMVRHFRNSPCVIMWSIGNEVPTQWTEGGYKTAAWLQSICHREDPTRHVTCGMDQFDAVINNGFGAQLDVPGFNYKPRRYLEAYAKLPHNLILGSETASTVSSRGVYRLPSETGLDGKGSETRYAVDEPQKTNPVDGGAVISSMGGAQRTYSDHQSTSFDNEFCNWSNIPDVDLAADEDYPWMAGQFVWTGFDYLGEPSPYDTDAWPSHSSVFGIIDLASIPKDRYYLYRSIWNTESSTLHVMPHWNWEGHEGERVPVMVYTSYPKAELFVNGKSQGIVSKLTAEEASMGGLYSGGDAWDRPLAPDSLLMRRFRLIWPDVVYEAGELKVVAYDENGKVAAEQVVKTAGKPYALALKPYESPLASANCQSNDVSDGQKELLYVNVSVTDRSGNPVPTDSRSVSVKVSGSGSFKAIANGDPASLESFQEPQMHLFSGQLTVIVQRNALGAIQVEVSAKGLRKATTTL